MDNKNLNEAKNFEAVSDNELEAVSGGGIFDFYTTNDRLKMIDGTVCKCGHAVGTLRPQTIYCLLICEKCGEPIGMIPNQSFVDRA